MKHQKMQKEGPVMFLQILRPDGLGKFENLCTDSLCSCIVIKVPVDGGPGMVKYAQMDQNGPERVRKYCCKTHGLPKH